MIDLGSLFDSYNRKARLSPALIAISPALAVMLSIFPEIVTSGLGGTVMALAVGTGLLYFAAEQARSQGKRLEPGLIAEWGGWPTTLWLRHRTNHLSGVTRARYHAFLTQSIPGLTLPTAAQEAADPAHADDCYRSATEWLKEQSRGKAPLVPRENISYGFRRNLLGLRTFGLTMCVVSLAGGCFFLWLSAGMPKVAPLQSMFAAANGLQKGALSFAVVALCAWPLIVTRPWVREAADAYAQALLGYCDAR